MAEVQSTTAVRQQVVDLLSPGSDEDFLNSLPESTATAPAGDEPRVRRKRRTKEEMAAARGEAPAGQVLSPDDPMSDPVYQKSIQRLQGSGGPAMVKAVCKAAKKPLDADEEKDVDALFYVASKRSKIDPGSSWLALILIAVLLFGRLLIVRTDVGEQLIQMLESKPEEKQSEEKQ